MFKVGDRVVGVGSCDGLDLTGLVGVVRTYNNFDGYLGVEFVNHNNDFHTINGSCKSGYGWWCAEKNLRPAEIVNV